MNHTTVLNARQQRILDSLAQSPARSTLDLARELDVSDQTIRRDLRMLAQEGAVEKYHGGVRLRADHSEPPFAQRLRTEAAAKETIAQIFEPTVPDDATLFLDNSSTACFVARRLARRSGLTIVTLSLEAARILAEGGANNRIIVPGGELRASDMTIVGRSVIDFASRFAPDYFVMSVAGIAENGDCMDFDLFEAEFKDLLMPRAGQIVLLADTSKFGRGGLMRTCALEEVDLLVCNAPPPDWLHAHMSGHADVLDGSDA